MSQHDDRLKLLCGDSGETLQRAKELTHYANAKTSQGSGFELKNSIGLPGACALIASEQLKNTIVDFESARANACLSEAAFSKCVSEVRAALALDASKQQDNRRQTRFGSNKLAYQLLITKYGLDQKYGNRFLDWCKTAEFTYIQLGKGNNIDRDGPKIKYAIFYWVCGVLKFDLGSFLKDEPHSDKARSISKVMDQHCAVTRASILEESKRSGTITTRTSPRKRLLRELPSKDSPKKRKLSAEPQTEESAIFRLSDVPEEAPVKPSTSPRKSPAKRALRELPTGDSRNKTNAPIVAHDSDVEMLAPETPSKTRRNGTAATAAFLSALSKTATQPFPAHRSSHHDSPPPSPSKKRVVEARDFDPLVADDDDDSPDDFVHTSSVRRRFRPVFLDRKQWAAQDPYLLKLRNSVEKRANGHSLRV